MHRVHKMKASCKIKGWCLEANLIHKSAICSYKLRHARKANHLCTFVGRWDAIQDCHLSQLMSGEQLMLKGRVY